MANADDILEGISDEEEEKYLLNTDVEEHIVIDIDRFIQVPDMLQRIAVQYDNKVETVTFDCPRYWDEHDLSTMYIYVNYLRSDTVKGRMLCKNVRIDTENPDMIHFEWTIGNEVTQVNGNLIFLICALTTNDDGMEDLHWNSELNSQMYISEGLESEDAELVEYADIITDLLTRMDCLIAANTPILDKSLTLEGFAAESKAVGDILRRFEEELMIDHFSQQFKILYITEKENEFEFDLGEWYAENCVFDIRVNGFDLNKDEYEIDLENNKVRLKKPLDIIGTPVELMILRDVTIKSPEGYEKLRGPRGYGIKSIELTDNKDILIIYEDDLKTNIGNMHTIKDITIQNGKVVISYTDGIEEEIGNLYDEFFAKRVIENLYAKLYAGDIYEKQEEVFNNWFSTLKEQLEGNVAANLENQILELQKNEIILSKDEPNRECIWYQILNTKDDNIYVKTKEYDENEKYSLEEDLNLETVTNMTDDETHDDFIIEKDENNN